MNNYRNIYETITVETEKIIYQVNVDQDFVDRRRCCC